MAHPLLLTAACNASASPMQVVDEDGQLTRAITVRELDGTHVAYNLNRSISRPLATQPTLLDFDIPFLPPGVMPPGVLLPLPDVVPVWNATQLLVLLQVGWLLPT